MEPQFNVNGKFGVLQRELIVEACIRRARTAVYTGSRTYVKFRSAGAPTQQPANGESVQEFLSISRIVEIRYRHTGDVANERVEHKLKIMALISVGYIGRRASVIFYWLKENELTHHVKSKN